MIRHPSKASWLVSLPLAALVVWAPLPFGSVEPAAAAWIRLAAFATLAVAVFAGRVESMRHVTVPVAAMAGIALLGALQSVSWPSALVALVSPAHHRLTSAAAALPADPGLGTGGGTALSLAPDLSRVAALNWLAAAALLLAAASIGASRPARRLLALALIGTAFFEIFYGLRSVTLRSDYIWGRLAPSGHYRLRGTFVNANHLANYLEMALAVMFAVTWWSWRRSRDAESLERRLLLVGLPALLWAGLLVGMGFSGSRAGLVACLGGALVQTALVFHRLGARRLALLGAGVVAAGLGAIAFVGFEEGFKRFFQAGGSGGLRARLVADVSTLELWTRFPILGSGLGSYREAFPLVQPPDLEGSWWHAHNDYLELLATVGLVGLVCFAAGLVKLAMRLSRVMRRGHRSEDRAAGLAALGAIAAVGVHELVDFGMTLPGNWVPLAVLCGLAAATPTARGSTRPLGPRPLQPGEPRGDGDPE